MERVLTLDARHHGKGTVLYSWHPTCQYLATVGTITSLINGTNNTTISSSSAPSTVNTNPHSPTRCVWVWALNTSAKERFANATSNNQNQSNPTLNNNSTSNPSNSSASSLPTGATNSKGGATLLFQIFTPTPAPVIGLEWDSTGSTLAILQTAPAHEVLLWNFATQELEHVDLSIKEATFMRWSKTSNQLAIGTARGEVSLYDRSNRACWYAQAKHKKRITAGDWNIENKFAFASDDRQITICSFDGKTFGQVKVKSKPTNVKFGGNELHRENIVSVSMDRKTILLYNLDDPENALELAFQQRYGSIVSFKWFRDGYIMVGFSLGYLVVISTHLDEIGREQFCARFHKDQLKDIAYNTFQHKVATVGETQIKIVDMKDWQEIHSEEIEPQNSTNNQSATSTSSSSSKSHNASSSALSSSSSSSAATNNINSSGLFDKLVWTSDGKYLSISARNGSLYVYAVDAALSSSSRSSSSSSSFKQRKHFANGTRRGSEEEEEIYSSLEQKLAFKTLPFRGVALWTCILLVLAAITLASSTGIPIYDVWKLIAYNWSV